MPGKVSQPHHRLLRASTTPGIVLLKFTGNIGWSLDAPSVDGAMEEAEADYDKVVIEVHGPGGSVFDGWAIYNRILGSPMATVTKCTGVAASMHSVVMMAGKEIVMCESSIMMIHEPWTFTYGNAHELRKEAATLEKVTKVLSKSYEKRTGLGKEEIAAMLKEETWLTPDEALQKGFIQRIDEGGDIAAPAKFGAMGKRELVAYARETMPENIADAVNNPKPSPGKGQPVNINKNIMDLKILAALVGLSATATMDEVQAKIASLVSQNTALTGTITALKEEQVRQLTASIDVAVSQAVAEGRITESDRQTFVELGRVNFKLMQDTIGVRPKAGELVPSAGSLSAAVPDDRKAWGLGEWMTKDPDGLGKLMAADPAKYLEIIKRG